MDYILAKYYFSILFLKHKMVILQIVVFIQE